MNLTRLPILLGLAALATLCSLPLLQGAVTEGILAKDTQLPLVMDGKTVGAVSLKAGASVSIKSVESDGVLIFRGDGTPFKVPADTLTQESIDKAAAAAAATPTPMPTPVPVAVVVAPTPKPVAVATPTPSATPRPPFAWETNMDIARKRSKAENKPLFILLTEEKCPFCKLLKYNVLEMGSVKDYISDHFIPVKLTFTPPVVTNIADMEVYKQYHVEGFPTSLITRTNGTELGRYLGYPKGDAARAFIAWMKDTPR